MASEGARSATDTRSGHGPTDAALVVAARAGERWAQEALFRRHAGGLKRLVFRILPSDADADDVVQDAFITALGRLDQLGDAAAFAAWLRSIAIRRSYKVLRRRRLRRRLGFRDVPLFDPDVSVAPGAPPDVVRELTELYAVVETLPPEERIALLLQRVERLPLATIAEEMGISLATVKRRIAAADARLAKRLGRG
ncbi:MAG: sigma-70 family RNA polymerase sigma factor [Myxococcota bacterium]